MLGVCLGHQALAHEAGAVVVRAPQPRHGRTSPVLHRGTELFAGLTSPFDAVRYHALTVVKLPTGLEATVWTPDHLLMGVAHRTRPMWADWQEDHVGPYDSNYAPTSDSHAEATDRPDRVESPPPGSADQSPSDEPPPGAGDGEEYKPQ